MKKIYLILSQSGSLVSKFLKLFTHDEYNHISLSLDENLDSMYSFARLKPNNPFRGGFVVEKKNEGMYKLFPKTHILVYEICTTDEKFKLVENYVNTILQNRKSFHYNFSGVIKAFFNKVSNRSHHFYCSQFVKNCLVFSGIIKENELPRVVRPMDFLKLGNRDFVYKGLLNNFMNKKSDC